MTNTSFSLPPNDSFHLRREIPGETRIIGIGNIRPAEIQAAVISMRDYGKSFTDKELNLFEREKRNLKLLSTLPEYSRHLPQFYGIRAQEIFLEFVSIHTLDALTKKIPKNDPLLTQVARSICEAVAFLHRNRLAHTALCPKHIVIDSLYRNCTAKLVDFKYLWKEGDPLEIHPDKDFYLASPEAWFTAASGEIVIADETPGLGYKDDIYRLGLILLTLLNENMVPYFVSETFSPYDWYNRKDALKQFDYMVSCYQADPDITSLGFLALKPKDRITADKALEIFEQLADLTPSTHPEFELAPDSRLPVQGTFKCCSFNTMTWKNRRISVANLIVNGGFSRTNVPITPFERRREHLNLLKMSQLFSDSKYFPQVFHVGRFFLIEACECDFYDLNELGMNPLTKKIYTRNETLKLIQDVAIGLVLLQESGYFYDDLKRENCLVTGADAKLTDFGGLKKSHHRPFPVHAGSINYAAPETVCAKYDGRETYPLDHPVFAANAWKLGLIALGLLEPSAKQLILDHVSLMRRDLSTPRNLIEASFQTLQRFASESVTFPFEGLLRLNPHERMTVKEALTT